jgi:Protein of unknown function (DUF3617)
MLASVKRLHGHLTIGTGFGLLTLLALSVLSIPVSAEDLPVFRQGMWDFQRTVGTQKMNTQRCASPNDDMKRQNGMLEKAGCHFSPFEKAGKTYTSTAECTVKSQSSHTTTVITVESDSAYTVQVDGTANGQSTKELLTARRTGDCKR